MIDYDYTGVDQIMCHLLTHCKLMAGSVLSIAVVVQLTLNVSQQRTSTNAK